MSSPNPMQNFSERFLNSISCGNCWRLTPVRPLGHERVTQLTPSGDREWVERQQQLTEELRGYLRSGGHFDFQGLSVPPGTLINKSRISGAALEIPKFATCCIIADRAAPSGAKSR